MRRNLASLFIPLLLPASIALAQEKAPAKHRIGVLVEGAPHLITPQIKGLLDGLEEAGYIQGKNLILDLLHENTQHELRTRLKAYIQQKVDVLVGTSGAETAVAKQLTDKVPIVFMPGSEPIRSGFVKSLARPDTNVTGLTFFTDFDDIGKQLEVFKEVVPSMRQVVVLYDGRRDNPTQTSSLSALRKAAPRVRVKLNEISTTSTVEAERSLSLLPKQAAAGVFLICGPLFKMLKRMAFIATGKRMPLFGCSASQVADEEVSLTYGPDLYYIGYRGASYVDRILKGAKPQHLPVETPTKFELVINLRVIRQIDLTVPSEVLILADRVIN